MTEGGAVSGAATSPGPGTGPETRYAALHRRIESGAAGEQQWIDMLKVCLELGKDDELLDAYRHLESLGPRRHFEPILAARGLLDEEQIRAARAQSLVTEKDLERSFGEGVGDALQYLVTGQVPVAAMGGTILFGLILALGGVGDALVGMIGANVVALPLALAVHAAAWAMGARILRSAFAGCDDPCDLAAANVLRREGLAVGRELAVVAPLLLLPGLLLQLLTPLAPIAAMLTLGGWALLPAVVALRCLGAGWRECGPAALWTLFVRSGAQPRHALLVQALAFAPVAMVIHFTAHQSPFLVACFAGMLSVVPVFLTSRFLGQVLHHHGAGVGARRDQGRSRTPGPGGGAAGGRAGPAGAQRPAR